MKAHPALFERRERVMDKNIEEHFAEASVLRSFRSRDFGLRSFRRPEI